MLRCNRYLEPSPQGASEWKIPICLVNSAFNSRPSARPHNRRGKERQWDLPIALQIKRGRFESAPELAAPATTIGSIWVGSIHRRGRRQRQIATRASACCCYHKVPAFTNAQRPPHQFAPETISSKRNEHDRTQTKAQQKSAALVDVPSVWLQVRVLPGPPAFAASQLRPGEPVAIPTSEAAEAVPPKPQGEGGRLARATRGATMRSTSG
jgi:hypothetical protein